MAVWTTPKTDWTANDYFNIQDYNRIIGNIQYIKELADKAYGTFSIVDMGDHKDYDDLIFADEINAIESNLTTIVENSYPFVIGDEQTYYANQKTPDYQEFNRIESACLLIYKNLQGLVDGQRRLAFRLGEREAV